MTTEDDFQAALDANPDDHNTRLVFADWLQERDDPRAEGYRALGIGAYNPTSHGFDGGSRSRWLPHKWTYWWRGEGRGDAEKRAALPSDWYDFIPVTDRYAVSPWWLRKPSRRAAEDASALAFAKLPTERRAALLAATPDEN